MTGVATDLGDDTPPAIVVPDEDEREALGRLVRDTWIAWARKQDDPRAHWLESWEALSEPMREVDRLIGEAVASWVRADERDRIMGTLSNAGHGDAAQCLDELTRGPEPFHRGCYYVECDASCRVCLEKPAAVCRDCEAMTTKGYRDKLRAEARRAALVVLRARVVHHQDVAGATSDATVSLMHQFASEALRVAAAILAADARAEVRSD